MGWATEHIARLKDGETISFRARGRSMTGLIESGELVTVAPVIDNKLIEVGDIVLCVVHGNQFLHLVIEKKNGSLKIANNLGHANGWTTFVYGRVIPNPSASALSRLIDEM